METIQCRTCGGVAHPATGCAYTATFIVCGPCTREFWAWLRSRVNSRPSRRHGGPSFYDHVNRVAPPVQIHHETE
jgi:hypothetical protein